ncbi:UPF0688 protein C1orf174 homolog [Hoplias malabaricus]|uniref:UPF0688 protein C1orf174 homolog n=1 Tax=Hoplias malabaricus TaxID=27720 RepID=UPI003461D5E2
MRNKQSYGNRREEKKTVPLKRLSVKSSTECVKRRALRRLVSEVGAEGRTQMAGESGERRRTPRAHHSVGGSEEKPSRDPDESVKTQMGITSPKERRGKENNAGKSSPAGADKSSSSAGKSELENSALQTDRSVFFDEDSNHVFPVEQFFGNLDVVEEFSRSVTVLDGMSRREYRRLHYYAKEDSDEEQT